MKHCHPRSLLFFARCSRKTLAEASNTFPWRYLPPAPCAPARLALPPGRAHSLLTAATLFFSRCDWTTPQRRAAPLRTRLIHISAALRAFPRVLSLDATNRDILFQGQLAWLLSQPSLRSLQRLRVCISYDRCVQMLVEGLPRLQTLHLLALDAARCNADHNGLLAVASVGLDRPARHRVTVGASGELIYARTIRATEAAGSGPPPRILVARDALAS